MKNLWRISSTFRLDKTIQLSAIDCEIALRDIYKRIKNLGNKDAPKAYQVFLFFKVKRS